MKFSTRSLLAAGSTALLMVLCPSPKAAHATSVGPAFPATPFVSEISLNDSTTKSVGPATGTLGVTSLTLSNFNSTIQQIFLSGAVFSAGKACGSAPTGGTLPQMSILVPPMQTVHLTYPTPLVFTKVNGISCLALSQTTAHTNSVLVMINGYAQ